MFPTRGGRMNRVVLGALAVLGLLATVSVVMLRDARSELRKNKDRAAFYRQNSDSMTAKLHVAEGKILQLENSLKEEMDARKVDNEAYKKQVEDLKALRAQDKVDRDNAIKKFEDTIRNMKGQIKELQEEFSRQVESNHVLEREKNDCVSRMDDAVQELEKYKSQAAELNTQLKQQVSELKVELQNSQDCKSRVAELQDELIRVRSQRDGRENLFSDRKPSVSLQSARNVTKSPSPADSKAGVLQLPPDERNGKKFLDSPGEGKLSSPKTKTNEGVGQKPPSEDDVVPRDKQNDVIQRPSFDNAEEQEDDQGPAPALRLSHLGANAAPNANLHPQMAGLQVGGNAPVWRGGNVNLGNRVSVPVVGLRDGRDDDQEHYVGAAPPQQKRFGRVGDSKRSGKDRLTGDQISNNYADFDDGDAHKHIFDQIGDGDAVAKHGFRDYIAENNQEDGDDAVDGQIPDVGADDAKDDNIMPPPPLEQKGRIRNVPNHRLGRRRFPQRREPGEVEVAGDDGEEGVMVNPH